MPDPVPPDDRFAAATAVHADVHADSDAGTTDTTETADAGTTETTGAAGPTFSRWSGTIRPGWDIAGNANGGYLLAIAARAMGAALGRPDPVTVTGHYLAPGRPGPVSVEVDVVKQGRTFGTATARLVAGVADGRPLLQALGTFGELADEPSAQLVDQEPPPMPPPEVCTAVQATATFPPPFMGKVQLRLHPDDATFLAGNPSGKALMRGWFRLREGEEADTIALLCGSTPSHPPCSTPGCRWPGRRPSS